MRYLLLALFFSVNVWAQQCSPYHPVKNWEANKDVVFTVAWVSCLHASGMAVSMDWNHSSTGVHIMGKGHSNSAYLFQGFKWRAAKRIELEAGPLYRLNNRSQLMLGHVGADLVLHRHLHITSRILIINPNLNYLNVGLKATI